MEPDLVLFCDGGCTANPGELAVAAVACNSLGEPLVESARSAGRGTNNVAEYRALAWAICVANLLGARRPMFCTDSILVAQQLNGWWAMRGSQNGENVLAAEFVRCRTALMEFDHWWLKHVPREKNRRADWLVSGLLGHARTLKRAPAIELVPCEGAGRPGWSEL